jgi:hypothetical protein
MKNRQDTQALPARWLVCRHVIHGAAAEAWATPGALTCRDCAEVLRAGGPRAHRHSRLCCPGCLPGMVLAGAIEVHGREHLDRAAALGHTHDPDPDVYEDPGAELLANLIDGRVAAAVRASGQRRVLVRYSAYSFDEDCHPADNLDEVAVPGRVVLVAPSYWAGKYTPGDGFRSQVLTDPTWLAVAVEANRMICKLRYGDHRFLEGLDEVGREGGVTVYEFLMGR